MLFAEFNALGFFVSIGFLGIVIYFCGYMIVCRPEMVREFFQQRHEREMQKRQQQNAMLGLGGNLLMWWLGRR